MSDPGYAVQSPGAAVASGGGESRSSRGAVIKLVCVVVALIVCVNVAMAIAGVSGSSNGRASSDELAQDLSSSMTSIFSGGMSDAATAQACEEMVGMMPEAAVNAALEKAGISSSADYASMLADAISAGVYSGIAEHIGKIDAKITISTGEALSSDYLSGINQTFRDLGLKLRATTGCELEAGLSATALGDLPEVSRGGTFSQSMGSMGYAIEIDGRWYLWDDSIDSMQ